MNTSVYHITVQELCEVEGISEQLLVVIVEHGIARPLSGQRVTEWVFDNVSAQWMKKAIRLQRDLDVDWLAVATVVDLLQERERLQQENSQLRQRLQRFLD